jgi:hypothetical protein
MATEFGYHTIGTSNLDFGTGVCVGCKFTLTETGTLSKISFYGKAVSGTVNVKAALFSVVGGVPSAKLDESSVTAVSTTLGWWDCNISGVSRAAGDYVLMLIYSADLTVYYLTNAGLGDIYTQEEATYPTFPTTSAGSFSWDSELSIYATYTPAGSGSSISPSASASLSLSPSASISPSASASLSRSPSSSVSPSASASLSLSPSASASLSRSPSASVSPSASTSRS